MLKIFACLPVLLASSLGCGDAASSTGGARLSLATRIELESPVATSRSGWVVSLERAEIAVGALHFFTGEPLEARLRPASKAPRVLASFGALLEGTAHAHPGHYVEGEALGQMLTPTSVDLLAGPQSLGDAEATSGAYRSARFTFGFPAAGPLSSSLGDAGLHLVGTATRDQITRRFRFRADAALLADASGKPELAGCHFDPVDLQHDAIVQITVKPSVWFAAADFSELAAPSDGEPVLVDPGTSLGRQLQNQVKASASMTFHSIQE